MPGLTLEVSIDAIVPGAWGWTRAGGWKSPLNTRLGLENGEEHLSVWDLDPTAGTARNQNGHVVALAPFMGVIGLPPDEPGIHSTIPPRECGGNIDCKELVAGSRLLLPITVPGALVSVGDGHAAQGDGEVSGLAIECPMDRVDLTFRLRDDLPLRGPRAETRAGTITFGFHPSLDEAAAIALEAMLDLLRERHGVEKREALALASVAVDLRVTQVVNGCSGVHAVLRPGAIR
jgi:acetamidase/formamidase